MTKQLGIIDYGVNNIYSIEKALKKSNIPYSIVKNSLSIENFTHLILPGVGAFSEGAKQLKELGFKDAIHKHVESGKFILGICLGMQLMFDSSDELASKEKGLSLFKGRCNILPKYISNNIHVPHIGWNQLEICKYSPLFKGVDFEKDFYFVHSFCVVPEDEKVVSTKCLHGKKFPASIEHETAFGVQFHPEKSYSNGFKILENFVSLN